MNYCFTNLVHWFSHEHGIHEHQQHNQHVCGYRVYLCNRMILSLHVDENFSHDDIECFRGHRAHHNQIRMDDSDDVHGHDDHDDGHDGTQR